MRVNPAIAALRGDRAPQRQAQAAMQQACELWSEEADVAQALSEFEKFGQGAALEECPLLEQIFTGQGKAEVLMQGLVRNFCAALAANPLGHPPFRNGYDTRASTMLLGKSGGAQLLLQAREPGSFNFPCATFTHGLRYDATLSGKASARIARIRGPQARVTFHDEPIALHAGVRLAFDCASEALLVEQVDTRLVTLRLLQSPSNPLPGREYCRETGDLLHQSAGSLATSRREMMVALLGRMERAEAAPTLAGIAASAGDESLRWQSLRECLALDTAQGYGVLHAIARNADDPLSGNAGALRAQLLETHPGLMQLEAS